MSYTVIKYDNYKSKELATLNDVQREKDKAINNDINEIEISEYELNKDYNYAVTKTKYFYIGGHWKKIMR